MIYLLSYVYQVNHVFFQYKKTTKFCSIKISHRYFTTSSKRDYGRMNESVQWIWQLGPSHIFVWGARCFQIGIHLFAKGCETRRYKHWYSFDLFILCVLAYPTLNSLLYMHPYIPLNLNPTQMNMPKNILQACWLRVKTLSRYLSCQLLSATFSSSIDIKWRGGEMSGETPFATLADAALRSLPLTLPWPWLPWRGAIERPISSLAPRFRN